MNWKTRASLAIVLMMVVPTVLVMSPAATAQDTVPAVSNVKFEPVVGFTQRLYLTFADAASNTAGGDTTQPQCTQPSSDPSGQVGTTDVHIVAFVPKPQQVTNPTTGASQGRTPCVFQADIGTPVATGGAPDTSLQSWRTTLPIAHSFNISGNRSLFYHHLGALPAGSVMNVKVLALAPNGGSTVIATNQTQGDGSSTDYTIRLVFDAKGASNFLFPAGSRLGVDIKVTAGRASDPTGTTGVAPSSATWTMFDSDSYLSINTVDGMRAATWIADDQDHVRDIFAPLSKDLAEPAPRIHGFFALQSAFGPGDARFGGDPVFSVYHNGQLVLTGPEQVPNMTGVFNQSVSTDAVGVATWSLPAGALDYRGLPTGDYTLVVDKQYGQGSTIRAGVQHSFSLSTQSIRLTAYTDAITSPETTSHTVVPGASSTYVMLLNNTGAVNDTILLDSSASGTATGWSAFVGGPSVHDRRIDVAPNESKIVTLTVTPPQGAARGSSAIFQVAATSTADPSVRSTPFVTITTVDTTIVRDVNVLFLSHALAIDGGVDTDFPVFAWNRGTTPANLSLEAQETSVQGWSARIYQNGIATQRVLLGNVPPGGIAETTLRMRGPLGSGGSSHPVTLNVTNSDSAGVALNRELVFSLRGVAGVAVKILSAIPGLDHRYVEVQGKIQQNVPSSAPNPQGAPTTVPQNQCQGQTIPGTPATGPSSQPNYCFPDSPGGMWFRVWVTNTGKVVDNFDLSLGPVTFAGNRIGTAEGCTDVTSGSTTAAARDHVFTDPNGVHDAVDNANFGFFTRDSDGKSTSIGDASGQAHLSNLQPNQTAEVWVWRAIQGQNDICRDQSRLVDYYNFVVTARSSAGPQSTGAIGTDSGEAIAVDTPNTDTSLYNDGVFVEAVTRTFSGGNGLGAPLVDITHSNDRLITGTVPVGQSVQYHVRVTDAASWAAHDAPGTDSAGNKVHVEPRTFITLEGVDRASGWNASIREIRTDNSSFPGGNATFLNERTLPGNGGTRIEAWMDKEYEITVTAPSASNRSVVGGSSTPLTVRATQGRASSTLNFVTTIASLADVRLSPSILGGGTEAFAHAGSPSALLVYVNNTGASRTHVQLNASIERTTQNALQWRVDPSTLSFDMAPYENRSVSFIVTPPAGLSSGARGQVNFLVDYAPNPQDLNTHVNQTVSVPIQIAGRSTLQLTATNQTASIGPGGTGVFTLNVKNSGQTAVPLQLAATPINNWSEELAACESNDLGPGKDRCLTLRVQAPTDVTSGSRYAAVVQVADKDNADNFDTVPLTIDILGGSAVPQVGAPTLQKRIDRGQGAQYEIQVRNVGSAAGVIRLESRMDDPAWKSFVQTPKGLNVSTVSLLPGELQSFNVTVLAPFQVPERVILPVDVTASTADFSSASHVTLRAEIHDYGITTTLTPNRFDSAIPGLPNEFVFRVKNTGNDNDTLNFSAIKLDNPDWIVQLSTDKIRLEANQEADIRAVVRSPTTPLPTPRQYEFRFYGSSLGATDVNLSKNDTAVGIVGIAGYRSLDVDGDGFLELAVDANRNPRDGFEQFKEIVSDGVQTNVVATAFLNGKASFFLDIPRDHGLDGIADAWYDPEAVYAFPITLTPDINTDGTPDYLVDTDRDGHIESAYDTVTERFLPVTEIHVTGDKSVTQYLVDFNNDGRPDYYYDAAAKIVTKTQTVAGSPNLVGIDTKNDGHVAKYYNLDTKSVEDAKVTNVTNFLAKFWYFFVAFAALLIVTIALIVRRRRG